jgi:hypothetical protein
MDEEKSTSQTGSPIQKDWTRGSILNNLLLLSWPMVVMEALYAVSQIWDLIWIGRLGSSAIAGAGIANIILMLILMMDIALTTGMRAVVARYIGEGNWRNAGQAAGQAYLLSAAWGVLVFVAGILLAGRVMHLFGVDAEVASYGMSYLKVMTAGWISMDILVMGLYILQSTGENRNCHPSCASDAVSVPGTGLVGLSSPGYCWCRGEQHNLPGSRGCARSLAAIQRANSSAHRVVKFQIHTQYHLENFENRNSSHGNVSAKLLRQFRLNLDRYSFWYHRGGRP